jgi:hypothetical protein
MPDNPLNRPFFRQIKSPEKGILKLKKTVGFFPVKKYLFWL